MEIQPKENLKKVEKNTSELLDLLDAFSNYFEFVGNNIIHLQSLNKNKLSKENSFIQILMVHEAHYAEEKNREELNKNIRKSLRKIFLKFESCHESWIILQTLLLKEKQFKISETTLKYKINYVNKVFSQILNLLVFYGNFDYNNFIVHKVKILKLTKVIEVEIQLMVNIFSGEENYIKEVDFSKLQKLYFDSIKQGDILLLRKEDFTLTPYRKFLKWLLQSNIMHSSLVYDIVDKQIYVIQANSHNSKKTRIDLLERKKGYSYLVLRPKKEFNKKQISQIKKLSTSHIGKDFSNLKIITGSLERGLEFLLRNFSFYRRHNNPLRYSKGLFCSEVVASIYDQVGCPLGISKDPSITSPIDILNSKNIKIVGFIE